MVSNGLYVHLIAKAGKEAEVENFLKAGLPIVEFGTEKTLSKSKFRINQGIA